MASNGKHLETNYRLGIVVLDGLHVFQGPEWCQNQIGQSNNLGKMNLLSKLQILELWIFFLHVGNHFLCMFFCSKCLNMIL